MLDAFHEDPFEADTMGAVEQAYEALVLPEGTPDLLVAAKCAANVLSLLEPELERMGCGAARVPEMLRCALLAALTEQITEENRHGEAWPYGSPDL